jgi:hypothetical protein
MALWQKPLRNEGSVFQDPDQVILDEAFHLIIKDIHVALEVKTSFGNSTPMTQYGIQHLEAWTSHWQSSTT